MKSKKILYYVLTSIAVGVVYLSYSSYTSKQQVSNTLLEDNIEALSSNTESGANLYNSDPIDCDEPYQYKKRISCVSDGTEPCNPSDCF